MIIIGRKYLELQIDKKTPNSIIHIGQDLESKEAVTIKELNIVDKNDIIEQELFNRECESLKILEHENIIKYYDSVIEDGKYYIIIEHFYGVNLMELVKNQVLTKTEILDISCKIINGLLFAHEKGIIHRDLKPSNIMVNDQFDVKIIDFGISKIIGYSYEPTSTVCEYLSVDYAAPETLLRHETTPKSDYYSLGLVMYFMFKRQDPPKDKKNLMREIELFDCSSEVKMVISELIRFDEQERTESLTKIKKILEREYSKLLAEEKIIYLRYTNAICRQLYERAMINSTSNKELIKKFIYDDVEESYFYRRANKYFVVGKDVVYTCKRQQDDGGLVVINIQCIDGQMEYDRERKKGIKVPIRWSILNEKQSALQTDSVEELIRTLIDEEKKRDVKKKKEQLKNNLLIKWEKYLKEEFQLLNEKNKLCHYGDFETDDDAYTLIAYLEHTESEFELEIGDTIQMTSKSKEQISVGEFQERDGKKIFISLKPSIDIEDISKKGIMGLDVTQAQSNLKRFARAINSLKFEDTANKNLPLIFTDPQLVEMNPVSPINNYFQDILNINRDTPQNLAIDTALSARDIFVLQGPPGTGKTTVISEIVCQILSQNPKAKILLSSQSHVAVDHAINKITEILPNRRIIRIGRSEKISKESQGLILANQLSKWVDGVKNKSVEGLSCYLTEHNDFTDKQQQKNKVIESIVAQWHKRLRSLEEFDEIFADEASIVASTCLGIATRNILSDMDFDWVIIDEAARATPLEILVPMVRGKKIVLVGDHRQLPPVVNSKMDDWELEEKGIRRSDLEKSLFEELIENIAPRAKMVLSQQFRMHPDIGQMIGDVFYPTENITTTISKEQRNHLLSWWPKTIAWIDTSQLPDCTEIEVEKSKKNDCEARVILNILEKIEKEYRDQNSKPMSVGIISGYNSQKYLLDNLINPRDTNKWKKLRIVIDNVDAFQGSETDIVIYSVVRCNPKNSIGFLNDVRRLNVALSRGKSCLYIVGNMEFLLKTNTNADNPFIDVIKYIQKHTDSCVVEVQHEY